ncbi:hypothetical protein ELI55_27000 (plasmid) [Rhizobium ruizarguesonis]|uniref:LysR family substrate-binding domain-containing protein n=1 Tax=Rhizobium ruizarguesonis TaxID=2081791 RepID=UPI00103236A2|nr:LysR family substrate-binding domain-containing protein [Rhizobium ruizarguesonis]TAT96164.1 hypothetical protein ELI55_27000 [Rhizobium ruizarguesonis]
MAESGKVLVGFVASAAFAGVLVKTITSFRRHFPNVEFEVREMEVRRQFQWLVNGDLDISIFRAPMEPPVGISAVVVMREPLIAVFREGHPLSLRRSVSVAEVAQEPILTIRQPSDVAFHNVAVTACNEAGVNATIIPVGADFAELGSLVGIGKGACLLAKSFEKMQMPGVCFVPVVDCETTSDVSIAFRTNDPSPAVANFVGHCKSMALSVDNI